MAEVPPELIQQTLEAITSIAEIPSVNTKSLSRPPAKVIQEIFTGISHATGFPDPSIIQEAEIPKEMKQERIDYIQSIISATSAYLKIEIPCEAKNITAGKEVPATLLFLLKLCEAGRLNVAARQQPEQEAVAPPQPQEEEPQQQMQDDPPPQVFNKQREAEEIPQQKILDTPAPQQYEAPIHQAPAYEPKQPSERELALQQQQQQEEELRQYEEIKRKQEAAEKDVQARTQAALANAMNPSDKPTFNKPPPSAAKKREVIQPTTNEAQYKVQIRREEDSEKDEDEQPQQSLVEQLGLEGNKEMAGLFDAPVDTGNVVGKFGKDIQDTANAFSTNIPKSQAEKRIAVQQKMSNQANTKLILAVQDAVRQVIPFSKATSFLEEHLIRMRQELMQAVDDCAQSELVRTKNVNIENKNKSVQEAKLRSVQEQIQQVKVALTELAADVIV